jgi:hypothetical protein
MNRGISLTELAGRIEGNRQLKQDYIAPARAIEVEAQSDGMIAAQVAGQGTFPVLNLAYGQLAEHTGVPKKYADRMRADAPELLAANMNRWLSTDDSKRMVRTLGGDMRAFLSNRYQRIENEEIAEVALPILADVPGLKIVSCEITERRMYIQATTDRVVGEVKVGDPVQAGVTISNSEVGYGAVNVQPLIYRLVCLNGMTRSLGLRAYHVGRAQDDTDALLRDDTRASEDRTVLLKVRDFVSAALDRVRFDADLERMRALTDDSLKVTGDPAKAVEVLAAKVGANEGEKGGILRSLIEGGDLSAWGMLNAVTAQAHGARDYDRSVEFQVAGGKLLDLSRKEWSEVLTAA